MNDGGGQGGGWKLDLPTLLAIVGAAAAIGLWINVVGGAVLWARFDAAGLPASQVVGIVPNTTLLAIGIKALALPLLVGIVAVAVFYISRPAETAEVKTRRPQPSPSAAKRDRPPVRKQFGPLFGAIGRASVSGFKSLWRRPSTMHAKPPPTDDDLPGIRGFGRVLVALLVLSVVTVLVLFGGDLDKPQHQEYLYAWAIAAPFLVLAAATYEPVNRGLLKKDWRDAALIAIGVAGFLLVCLVGWLAGHVWPAVWVGLLSFAASLLSLRLPPGHKFANLLSAGMLLIFFYLGLGAALYFFACDGSATLKPGDQALPLVIALLTSTLGLLFLAAVSQRTNSFTTVAVLLFAVVAAWGGIVGYLRERNGDPQFDLTALLRKSETGLDSKLQPRPPVSGFLIARTGDAVLVAITAKTFGDDPKPWKIEMIPRDQVEEMSVGPSCVINEDNLVIAAQLGEELRTEHAPNTLANSVPEGSTKLKPCTPPT